MLGRKLLLLIISLSDIRMFDKFGDALSIILVMLEALTQEQDALHGQIFHDALSEAVVAVFDLFVELISVSGVERGLSVQHFKQNDTDGPDVSLIRILVFLYHLGSHVQWGSANGLVALTFVLQLFRKAEVCNFEFKVYLGEVNFSHEFVFLFLVHFH
jgi:hypothetical protein